MDEPTLAMDEPTLDRLREAARRVLDRFPAVAAAYAHGSRVDGRPLPRSDLDLVLVLEGLAAPRDPLLAERISALLASELGSELPSGVEVDAHLAERLPLPVLGRVVTRGVLIYERSPVRRVEFETSTRRLYFDFLPLLERDAREGLRSGG